MQCIGCWTQFLRRRLVNIRLEVIATKTTTVTFSWHSSILYSWVPVTVAEALPALQNAGIFPIFVWSLPKILLVFYWSLSGTMCWDFTGQVPVWLMELKIIFTALSDYRFRMQVSLRLHINTICSICSIWTLIPFVVFFWTDFSYVCRSYRCHQQLEWISLHLHNLFIKCTMWKRLNKMILNWLLD